MQDEVTTKDSLFSKMWHFSRKLKCPLSLNTHSQTHTLSHSCPSLPLSANLNLNLPVSLSLCPFPPPVFHLSFSNCLIFSLLSSLFPSVCFSPLSFSTFCPLNKLHYKFLFLSHFSLLWCFLLHYPEGICQSVSIKHCDVFFFEFSADEIWLCVTRQ